MTPEILAQAQKAQRAAEGALARMASAQGFPAFEDAWNEFLSALGKVWTRAIAVCKANPTTTAAWRSNQERVRKTDPLLRYLLHARNSDQHSVADGIKLQPAQRQLRIPQLPGGTYIKSLRISEGGKVTHYEGNAPLEVHYTPAHPTLLAVTDRGQRYDPPWEHLGTPVPRLDPFIIAELGVKFSAAMIEELRELIPPAQA